MRTLLAIAVALALAAPFASAPAVAQERPAGPAGTIAGLVLDARTDEPLPGADIVVENVRGERVGRAISDETGHFFVALEGPGLYALRLVRLGYDSTTTVQVAAARDQDLFVEIRANPLAVGLDPIRVSAPRVVPYLVATGFYARERRGLGSFVGPKELQRIRGAFPSQALRRIPGVHVRFGHITMRGSADSFGSECTPAVYLDGMQLRMNQILDDLVPMQFIEAIEVYKGPSTIPAQWRGNGACGVVALWTRR